MMISTSERTVTSSSPLRYSQEVASGVYRVALSLVNVYLVGNRGAGSGKWVLVDAGLNFSASKILHAAEELYGRDSRPAAIILTHGHFDHVGALKDLAAEWDVPVYCHRLETPYLDGRSSYPPPDPAVGGGAMSLMSPLYPRGPINIGRRLQTLPRSGSIPGMPGWEWIHTPGHTPGHVSLYREEDAVLIAGDAFVTTCQESMLGALLRPKEINGPPKYFTTDWEEAWRSVVVLSQIPISVAATGHGEPLYGARLREGLRELAEHFWTDAVPRHGRYVDEPAEADVNGVHYVPPREFNTEHIAALALAAGVLGAIGIVKAIRK